MTENTFDVAQAHRWFAVELNNLAWELAELPDRTPDEAEQMVHAAHAACFHWLQVGSPLNHQRAQCLLTTIYARLGYAEAAIRHAEKCLELSRKTGDDQTEFDRATAFGCAALAYQVANQPNKSLFLHQKADEVVREFDDPNERRVFIGFYGEPQAKVA